MSRPVIDRRSHRRLRASLLAVAVVLGVLAVCLLVFGSSARQLKLGAIVGLWAALIAAFEAPAFRRPVVEPAQPVDLAPIAAMLDEHSQSQLVASQEAIAAQSGELRRVGELQLARESAARREADVNLQLSIRHEIERTMVDQFGLLRQEVSSLRAEVFDKLGGQIKLERIETTRLIGSDLEALQNQIRRLAEDREGRSRATDRTETEVPGGGDAAAAQPVVQGQASEIVDAEVVESAASPVRVGRPALVEHPPVAIAAVTSAGSAEKGAGGGQSAPSGGASPATGSAAGGSAPLRPRPPIDAAWSVSRSVRSKSAEVQPATAGQSPPSPSVAAEPPDPAGVYDNSSKVSDLFADLPRLTPVPPEVLAPLPEPERSGRRRAPEDDPDSPHYIGRRRPDVPRAEQAPNPEGENSGRRRAPGHASE